MGTARASIPIPREMPFRSPSRDKGVYFPAAGLGPTSEVGHLRPNWAGRVMSGLPSLATELRTSLMVRFVPQAVIA
jgi:hypothetical protein